MTHAVLLTLALGSLQGPAADLLRECVLTASPPRSPAQRTPLIVEGHLDIHIAQALARTPAHDPSAAAAGLPPIDGVNQVSESVPPPPPRCETISPDHS